MKYFTGYKLARCISSLRDNSIKEGEVIQFGCRVISENVVYIISRVEGPNYKKGTIKEEFGFSIPEIWFHKHFEILE